MTTIHLGEVIRPASGRAGASELPVYSVTKHKGFVPSKEYFTKQVFSNDTSGYKVVEPGNFAYATIHLDEGSIGVAPERCIISPMYTVFTVDDSRVDQGYLLRFLKAPSTLPMYSSLGRGTAERRKSIPLDALGRLAVPLPPLPEQRRIAAILDEADAVRGNRLKTLSALDGARSSAFLSLDRRAWQTTTLGQVADLQGGLTLNARRATLPARASYLRVANVFRGWLDLSDLKELGVTQAEVLRTELRIGDVLVVEGHGNAQEVGRAALVDSLPDGQLTHQNHLFRLRPREGVVLGRFLELSINAPASRKHMQRVANTTSGLNTLNATSVRSLPIQLAPLDVQQRIVEEQHQIDHQLVTARQSASSLDSLFASLQHRAFRGEL